MGKRDDAIAALRAVLRRHVEPDWPSDLEVETVVDTMTAAFEETDHQRAVDAIRRLAEDTAPTGL